MRFSIMNVLEMVMGAILIGVGLLYLTKQYQAIDCLSDKVSEAVLGEGKLYQQYNDINVNRISAEELYAVVMGYREYPIRIDGIVMSVEDSNVERYLTLIKDGYYLKTYEYNTDQVIIQVIYMFSGA